MLVEGIVICDICGGAIFPDDVAPITRTKDGKNFTVHLHNRKKNDCIKTFIKLIAEQYAASK